MDTNRNVSNGQMDINFEKNVMIHHKDREVRFKCKVFYQKPKMKTYISSVKNRKSTFD
jgi:hypothetical protein